MKDIGIIVAILIGIALIIFLLWYLHPYVIKHDTTILFTGPLGSGKSLESVKRSILLVKKNRFFKYTLANLKVKIINANRKLKNKLRLKHASKLEKQGKLDEVAEYIKKKPQLTYLPKQKRPLLYSNIPIHFRPHLFSFKKEWSVKLTVEHITLLKKINEYSVVFIDEFPQFISQFEWNEELVQTNCNEFITFFRHYIGGHLIINAQSEDEIECHFRRKLNSGVWCFDFHVWPFPFLPLFYTNRMCDFMLSDNITTMSTTYIEDNTRIHFGLFPRRAYDSRCYKPRYENVERLVDKVIRVGRWTKLTTTEILRLKPYISPLDTKTTKQQVDRMLDQVAKLKRNNDSL